MERETPGQRPRLNYGHPHARFRTVTRTYLAEVESGMEDYLLGDSLSGTRWIGAGSTALGLEGRLQGSDIGEPFYIMRVPPQSSGPLIVDGLGIRARGLQSA